MPSWSNFSEEERKQIFIRAQTLPTPELARELGMLPTTLSRRLREMKEQYRAEEAIEARKEKSSEPEEEKPLGLEASIIIDGLKKGPKTLSQIADLLDVSPKAAQKIIELMRKDGFRIVLSNQRLKIDTAVTNQPGNYKPRKLIADMADVSGVITLGIGSDLHAGSIHSQPTAYNRFVEIAYEEYGVRNFLDPGDVTTGVFGYRGQELDLIPEIRPRDRKDSLWTTRAQIELAKLYTPYAADVTHYKLGGNHDWWHVTASGVDAVYKICEERPDFRFLEYDAADIPLTDKVNARLWHPTGGVPYALTYRLQKGVEQMAFAELNRAILENQHPKLRLIIAGHLHIEAKFESGPYLALHPGCFEGQTNYLKKKGLTPVVGGAVLKLHIGDNGLLLQTDYSFIRADRLVGKQELKDDWMNWDVPAREDVLGVADAIEPIFTLEDE